MRRVSGRLTRRAIALTHILGAARRSFAATATAGAAPHTIAGRRIIRFADRDGAIHFGEPLGESAPDGSGWAQAHVLGGDIFRAGGATRTGATADIARLLSPLGVADVPAIFGIGLNYRAHAEETGHEPPAFPIYFMKNPACLSGPGDPIVIPPAANWPERPECDYEAELAIVVGAHAVSGAPCKDVRSDDALQHVLGFACANDVSARRWQGPKRGGGQWCRSKSFDTFLPFGPCLATPQWLAEQQGRSSGAFDPSSGDPAVDGDGLRIFTELNGATVQDSTTADMIFDVPQLISFLSEGTTLLPGTVILTGTPSGVGFTRKPPLWLKHGDSLTVGIDGLGALTNPVVEE